MSSQVTVILIAASLLVTVGLAFLWRRMPVYRWYCRRCKKIVSSGRLHPAKCSCGTTTLVAYFCKKCTSWNTSPSGWWHCGDCKAKEVLLGVEYQHASAFWRWRHPNV